MRQSQVTTRLRRASGWPARLLRLAALTAGACLTAPVAAQQPAADTTRWNIVFILADDLGWNQTGYGWNQAGYPGAGFYETPNVDRLAAQGMVFADAYAAASICSPTRAALMTGKYPARLHITDYIPGAPFPYARLVTPRMQTMLPLAETTIAELLKRGGYATGHFGKWHLNVDYHYAPGRPGDPASQGFDEVLANEKPEEDADPNKDPHHVEAITRRSLDFLERHRAEPFFLYVAHHVVHRPLHAPPDRVAKYAAKPGGGGVMPENNPVMGAMIETMDEGIGRIMAKLDELELTERTVVIFTSDNGGLEMLQDQEPLRGGKAMLWEGGIRVPLAVRWPGVIEPGSTSSVPVITQDWFPTLAEWGRVKAPAGLDGQSLVPLLRGVGTPRRDALYWHYPHYHHLGFKPSGAIREGRYKLVEWYEESITGGDQPVSLYDLGTDLGERVNLADRMPEKAAALRARLAGWRRQVGAQEMVRNPNYDREKAHWRYTTSALSEPTASAGHR
jgi:arylsulfatase A